MGKEKDKRDEEFNTQEWAHHFVAVSTGSMFFGGLILVFVPGAAPVIIASGVLVTSLGGATYHPMRHVLRKMDPKKESEDNE